jgi:hypothetical protein
MGLLGSFLGKDQRKDIQRANAQANQYLDTGYNSANADYGQAIAGYDPYVQSGQQANTFYSNALGLNGADAQNQSLQTLTSNPLFQGQLAQDSNALLRTLNAQGASGGGKAQLAGQRVFQQTAGNWLDRYNQLGSQGLQATGAQGNALMGRGDLASNYASAKAGNAINYGNALAQSRNTSINNLLGVAGLGVSALTGGLGVPKTTGDVGLGSWSPTIKYGR